MTVRLGAWRIAAEMALLRLALAAAEELERVHFRIMGSLRVVRPASLLRYGSILEL